MRGKLVHILKFLNVVVLIKNILVLISSPFLFNYEQIWHFRRLVIEALNSDLIQEKLFVDNLAQGNPKNYQTWHHKRWLAEKMAPDAAADEHNFARLMLCSDAKNYPAWSRRQWVLQTLGGWRRSLTFAMSFWKKIFLIIQPGIRDIL